MPTSSGRRKRPYCEAMARSPLARAAVAVVVLTLLSGCAIGGPHASTPTSASITATPSDAGVAGPSDSAAPADASPASLAGTDWSGSDSDGDPFAVHFLEGGGFTYTNTGNPDVTPNNETWTLTGSSITMRFNDGFATRVGTVTGDTMSGTASNVDGTTWTWKISKQ